MRYGLVAESLKERIGLLAGKVPVPVIDCLAPLVQVRALMTAVKLGVLEAMGDQPRSAAQLAAARQLDPDALDLLLRVLVSMRYVEQHGNRYRLSKLGLRTLTPGASMDLRAYVEANYIQWKLIDNLERLLETGRGIDLHECAFTAAEWETYQRAMRGLASTSAEIVAALMPVPAGATRMLDLGGSHGLLGAAICRRHPPMRSTVVDLAPALASARRLAREAQIDDVVEHREGNLLSGTLGDNNADVVLLANIVHHFSPEQNIDVLQRARAALRPGGAIGIWDFERPASDDRVEAVADGAALFFRLTSTSGVMTAGTYEQWLREAGLVGIRSKRSMRAPNNVLTVGFR